MAPDRRAVPFLFLGLLVLGPAQPADAAVRPFGADEPAEIAVSFDSEENRYTFLAEGAQTVVYTLDLDDSDIALGMLRIEGAVDGREPITIVTKAGTRYRSSLDVVHEPDAIAPAAGAQLLDHHVEGETVVLRYREQPESHSLEKTYRLTAEGISLMVEFVSEATWGADGYAGVSLGWAETTGATRVVHLPYLPEPVALFSDGTVMTAYVDPTVSSAVTTSGVAGPGGSGQVFAHGRSLAEPDTAGVAAPLSETAYITLSEDLRDVMPRVTGAASPFRSSLSPRLVLDVWGLHRSFATPEGVAVSWESREAGFAHLELRYADTNAYCGDGVRIFIRHNETELNRIFVANGDTVEQSWDGDIELAAGDTVRLEIDRAGTNVCDSTRAWLTIDTLADFYDSQADFSGTQGHRGFNYLEYLEDEWTPMTWNEEYGQWNGSGSYSRLWPGGGHPGQGKSAYLDAERMVHRYREYGLTRLAVIFHVWQRWGYDEGLPDHHPANPDGGTGEQLGRFVTAARQAGMLVSFHENYTDMYPDDRPDHPSPLWDPSAIALDRYGNPKLGWYHAGTGQQAFRIAARRMLGFAEMECPSIATDYQPNAAFLDVNTGWSPNMAIDHDAAGGATPTLADAHDAIVELFEAMKVFYGGPLLGEGGEGTGRFDSYFAGSVDAVERQTERRSRAWVAPDYELLAVKPRMFNHGMGYYSRYFTDSGQQNPTLGQADLDQYRASEIAFAHAGFLGDGIEGVPNWMRLHGPEYWLMQALQSRYADEEIESVTYDDAGTLRDLEEMLRVGTPLATARVRLEFANGLVVSVNRDSPNQVASVLGDYSHEQGYAGWRYWEERESGRVPLNWDPVQRRWQGSRAFLLLYETGGHPDLHAAVRTWTAPATATVRIEGSVSDLDTSCGDGVLAQVRHGSEVLWECDLSEPVAPPCDPFDLTRPVVAGEEIVFRIDEKGDNSCDSTAFPATISWNDGADHDWTVSTPDGPAVLPPSGFVAHDPQGFRAYSAKQDGVVVDYVGSPEYRFARSRDGQPRSLREFETDGGIAVVPTTLGDELHGLELTRAERHGELLVATSARGDVNVRPLDSRRAVVTVRDLDSGFTTDVTWGALPESWRAILGTHAEDLELLPSDDDGEPQGGALPVSFDPNGNPFLAGLYSDQPYLLRLTSECVYYGECAESLACCTGRCVAEPTITAMDRDAGDVVLVWTGACPSGYTILRSTDPADFSGAEESFTDETTFRDEGAGSSGEDYFYLVR